LGHCSAQGAGRARNANRKSQKSKDENLEKRNFEKRRIEFCGTEKSLALEAEKLSLGFAELLLRRVAAGTRA
jgi:hypothetical protein